MPTTASKPNASKQPLTLSAWAIFGLLIAIGVVGRWGQPDWGFTPIMAVSLFAGRYFDRRAMALAVPFLILLISNFALDSHNNLPVALSVYAAFFLPALLGRWLGRDGSTGIKAARWAVCGLLPAVVFFLVTNLAVWMFRSDYPATLAGLTQCYVAGVPFFRSMLAGDIVYLLVVFGAASLAGVRLPQRSAVRA